MIDPLFSMTSTAFIAALFLFSGLHKIKDLAGFRRVIFAYQLFPESVVVGVAFVLPVLEIAIALGLWMPVLRPATGSLAIGLLALYSLAMAINLYRGRTDIDCGCSWHNWRAPLSGWNLLRNTVLIILALMIILPVSDRTTNWFDLINITMAAMGLGLFYLTFEMLLTNRGYLKSGENL